MTILCGCVCAFVVFAILALLSMFYLLNDNPGVCNSHGLHDREWEIERTWSRHWSWGKCLINGITLLKHKCVPLRKPVYSVTMNFFSLLFRYFLRVFIEEWSFFVPNSRLILSFMGIFFGFSFTSLPVIWQKIHAFCLRLHFIDFFFLENLAMCRLLVAGIKLTFVAQHFVGYWISSSSVYLRWNCRKISIVC